MDIKDAEEYLERTLRFTQEMYMRQTKRIERELTLDGLTKRLSQFADTVYLVSIISVFPVCVYSLGRPLSPQKIERAPAIIQTNSVVNEKGILDYFRNDK